VCVAVRCSELQCAMQYVAVCVGVRCSELQCALQCVAVCVGVRCSELHHPVTSDLQRVHYLNMSTILKFGC